MSRDTSQGRQERQFLLRLSCWSLPSCPMEPGRSLMVLLFRFSEVKFLREAKRKSSIHDHTCHKYAHRNRSIKEVE